MGLEPEKSLQEQDWDSYLEDHPMTIKWLRTMVIVSPLRIGVVGPLPNGLFMAYYKREVTGVILTTI